MKRHNKLDLAAYTARNVGVIIDPDALCDVMIKRFHEYKRQLLRVLHVIALYHRIRRGEVAGVVPRTIVFGGKAAPGYYAAKRIMRLANTVADLVNEDPAVSPYLKMIFLPDYNVSRAQLIIPAADLSEQISLAGKEASGTSNMKLALNGALTIGTLDGANVEIRDRVGADNFFLFGLDITGVAAVKERGYVPRDHHDRDPELREVLATVADHDKEIADDLLYHAEYLTLADYRDYVDCQDRVAKAWQDQEGWTRASILNTARSGFFSSDRTVRDYCRDIWHVTPLHPDN